MHQVKQKTKKAYSLLELLVSLGIVAIIMTMFSNILVGAIRTTLKVSARSAIREELSSNLATIRRDLRSADQVIQCADPQNDAVCSMLIAGQIIEWRRCSDNPEYICKINSSVAPALELYRSPEQVKISQLTFDRGFEEGETNKTQRNILITIVGSDRRPAMSVNNMIFQTSVSTRNYILDQL